MFQNNSDEDFDFDLDEVVKLDAALFPSAPFHDVTNSKLKVIPSVNHVNDSTLKKDVEQDWGSDDDSPFLEIADNVLSQHNSSKLDNINANHQANLESQIINKEDSEVLIIQPIFSVSAEHPKEILLNNSPQSDWSKSPTVEPRFPGPAGLLTLSNKKMLKGHISKKPRNQLASMNNMDGLSVWDKALFLLDVTALWNERNMNLYKIKRSFSPGVAYLRAPLLIVGIQSIELTAVIKSDVKCGFQDPTAEADGSILKDVVVDYGKFMQPGCVLVLHHPRVLKVPSNCLVTVTKTCLIGMLPPHSNEFIKCRDFTTEELASWLSEPVVCGDPVLYNEKMEEEQQEHPATLFTSVTSTPKTNSNTYSNLIGIEAPAPSYRPYHEPPSSSFVRNSSRCQTKSPEITDKPYRSSNELVRTPGHSDQFRFKSPSAVTSTAPCVQSINKFVINDSSTPKSGISTANQIVSQDEGNEYLSKFLEGIDTDSLFEDF